MCMVIVGPMHRWAGFDWDASLSRGTGLAACGGSAKDGREPTATAIGHNHAPSRPSVISMKTRPLARSSWFDGCRPPRTTDTPARYPQRRCTIMHLPHPSRDTTVTSPAGLLIPSHEGSRTHIQSRCCAYRRASTPDCITLRSHARRLTVLAISTGLYTPYRYRTASVPGCIAIDTIAGHHANASRRSRPCCIRRQPLVLRAGSGPTAIRRGRNGVRKTSRSQLLSRWRVYCSPER